jgi:hypothetical protein
MGIIPVPNKGFPSLHPCPKKKAILDMSVHRYENEYGS